MALIFEFKESNTLCRLSMMIDGICCFIRFYSKCDNEINSFIQMTVALKRLDDFSVPLGISLWSWERDTSL